MSSVPAKFEKGTQSPAAYLNDVKKKNKIFGIALGIVVLALMSLAMLMKG